MTNQTQQQPKKQSLGLMVVLGLLGLAVFMVVGKALSYFGIMLGVLAAGGGGFLLVKGPPERRKLAVVGIGVGLLLVLFGNMGASEGRARAAAESAAADATKKKADDDKAKSEKLIADLAALPASAASAQVSALCADVAKLGAIPAAHAARCGDAFLAEGRSALTSKRYVDAVALLEQAATLSSKKDDAATALADAKVAVAVEMGSSEAARAEKALEGKDLPKAAKVAKAAAVTVAAAQKLKPDDASLKEVGSRLEAVLAKADPEKRSAAEKAAFDAMGPAEHLKAAKDALADGYDAKARTGGLLDDAEKHLAVIVAPAKEEKEVKALRSEIEARRKRAGQADKIASVVRDADKDATFEVSGGRLIVTVAQTNIGGRMKDIIVDGYLTLGSLAKQWDDMPDIQSITVIENSTFEDVKGNEKPVKVGEYTVSRAKAKGINWSRIRSENILKAIDKSWVAPGVGITVD